MLANLIAFKRFEASLQAAGHIYPVHLASAFWLGTEECVMMHIVFGPAPQLPKVDKLTGGFTVFDAVA